MNQISDVDILLLQFHSDPQLWFPEIFLLDMGTILPACFIEKHIFSALPYLGSWIQDSSLTRVFWFFPTAPIKPSSSQWIDHSTTVGSWRIASSYTLWGLMPQLLYLWWVGELLHPLLVRAGAQLNLFFVRSPFISSDPVLSTHPYRVWIARVSR